MMSVKNNKFKTSVILITILFLASCSSSGIQLTDEDNARTISVKKDQVLTLSLQANPTTGYTWDITEMEGDKLEQVGKVIFKPDSSLIGAPGLQIFKFKAKEKGETILELVYHRPWEKQKPAKIFSVIITVN